MNHLTSNRSCDVFAFGVYLDLDVCVCVWPSMVLIEVYLVVVNVPFCKCCLVIFDFVDEEQIVVGATLWWC